MGSTIFAIGLNCFEIPNGIAAGGAAGLATVISALVTRYLGIRIGVGTPPPQMDLVDWVLGKIPKEEIPMIRDVCDEICEAVPMIIAGETEAAMNRYNRKK